VLLESGAEDVEKLHDDHRRIARVGPHDEPAAWLGAAHDELLELLPPIVLARIEDVVRVGDNSD